MGSKADQSNTPYLIGVANMIGQFDLPFTVHSWDKQPEINCIHGNCNLGDFVFCGVHM